MLERGVDCFTRLLSSGHKTNPWYHEAGSKLVRPSDLVAFDTDMTGPEGLHMRDLTHLLVRGEADAHTKGGV